MEKQELFLPYKLNGYEAKPDFSKNNIVEKDIKKSYDEVKAYFDKHIKEGTKPEYDGFCRAWKDPVTGAIEPETSSCYLTFERMRRDALLHGYRYDENGKYRDDANEPIEFTVKCRMNRRWADEFASFLRHIEMCGNIGHSSMVAFYADGDGDFRPKFDIGIAHKAKKNEPSDDNKEIKIVDDLGPCPKWMLHEGAKPEVMFDAG